MKHPLSLLTLAITLAAPALAQEPVDPKDVPEAVKENFRKQQEEREKARIAQANATNPAKPIERPLPTVKSTDPDVQAMVKLLTGTFASEPSGDTPALLLNTAVITVEGIDNAIYFEIARADSAWAPFRQGVWQVWKKGGGVGGLSVRQYEFFDLPATFNNAVAGLWTVPDMFPVLKSSNLIPASDVALTSGGGNFSGSGAGPTLRLGAFEFTTSWIITPESLSFTDRGTDISGKQVWGPSQGSSGPAFKRAATTLKTERRPGGVIVIDYVPPSPTERKVEENSDVAATLVGYSDGGVEFYNSNAPRPGTTTTEPFRWTVSSVAPPRPNGFQGLNAGMMGATAGTIRRIYAPAALGFGPNRSGNVMPNSDLVFTVQTRWVGEPKAPVTPPAPTGTNPTGTPVTAPGAAPANLPVPVKR